MNHIKRNVRTITMLIAFFLASALAFGAEQKIELKPAKMKSAKGEAVLRDAPGGQKEITLHLSGLKPDSVYTLWFVNEKPNMDMAGVGKPDYDFKSDAGGHGMYKAIFPAAELEKWQILEVAYHPNGNPKNMKNIQPALKGKLK